MIVPGVPQLSHSAPLSESNWINIADASSERSVNALNHIGCDDLTQYQMF
jgi:hypothetical protein